MAVRTGILQLLGGAFALMLAASAALGQGRSFFAEGSDAVQGVGARHLAMGGTGVATANDPHAVFYNPSLLADVERPVVTVTRQIDGRLRPYTFIGAAVPVPGLDDLGIDVTLGVARYNRIHARSTGAFGANEPESVFLRYLLPGIKGTFDGDIDSKTLVNRFAVGVGFNDIPGLNLGFNIDYIDCDTNTCGVHTASNGYETRSVKATALSWGISASYKVTDRVTFGFAFTDVDTLLTVRRTVTDDLGTRNDFFTTPFPKKVAAEVSWQVSDRWLVAVGGKREWGDYGSSSVDFLTFHGGVEYAWTDQLTLRAGAWSPFRLETSHGNNIDIPVPLAPTAGIGWTFGDFSADVSLYAHPLMTLHRKFPEVSGEISLSYRF